MKRWTAAVLTVMLAFLCAFASADTPVPVAESAYTIFLPSDVTCAILSYEERVRGLMGAWYNDQVSVEIHRWAADDCTLEQNMREDAERYNADFSEMIEVNGLQFGHYRYIDSTWQIPIDSWMFYLDDLLLEIDFVFENGIADYALSERIIHTISENGVPVRRGEMRLAWSCYVMSVQDGLVQQAVSAEEMASGITDALYNNDMMLEVIRYDAEGYSVTQLARMTAEQQGSDMYGVNYINSIPVGYWVVDETGEDDGLLLISYILRDGKDAVELFFMMKDAAVSAQVAAMVETIRK